MTQLVQYAKTLGIKTEVTSNCISHDQARLVEVAECVDKWNISLDTLSRDIYRKIRGVDCFDQVMETIRELNQIRTAKTMTVVTEDNLDELEGLVRFAQKQKNEIYLNPAFSYFNEAEVQRTKESIAMIKSKIYQPNTVVMLHFLEFLRNIRSENRPDCSANVRTLTFAPDGSLMLPCYHAVQEHIPWSGNLNTMLATEQFKVFSEHGQKMECCKTCGVIPYFGISFNYHLDSYFLLQSYSEKLNHLKQGYLNRIPQLKWNDAGLMDQLQELFRIVRSLKKEDYSGHLYVAEKQGKEYVTDIYRKPLSEAQYFREQQAEDCWHLELVPHYGFDLMCETAFRYAFDEFLSRGLESNTIWMFQGAIEFQLHFWKIFVSKYMNVTVECNYEEELAWLIPYLKKIMMWGHSKEKQDVGQAMKVLIKILGYELPI